MTSTDGINWIQKTIPNRFTGVCYGNGNYFASGLNGYVYKTSDLNSEWVATSSKIFTSNAGIAFGNNIFVLFGYINGTNNNIATSTDGINWPISSSPYDSYFSYGEFLNGKFYGLTSRDITRNGMIISSSDGINWNFKSINYNNWCRITSSQKLLIAISYNTNYYYTSSDGINWNLINNVPLFTTYNLSSGIAYGNNTLVCVGNISNSINILVSK